MSLMFRATLLSCSALAVVALQYTANSDPTVLFKGNSDSDVKKPPHLVFILADDLGWGNVGFNLNANSSRPENKQEIHTPVMDKLVREEGVHLLRHYTSPVCSPSRVSFQSGRFPVHGSTTNDAIVGPQVGLPLKMTGIAEQLSQAGYKSHVVGKWDVGMARKEYLPQARGWHSSLVYFSKGNDMWDMTDHRGMCNQYTGDQRIVDLWDGDSPAYNLVGTKFQEYLFRDRALKVIAEHNTSHPLFLFYSSHLSHHPTQLPLDVYHKLPAMPDDEPLKMHHPFGPRSENTSLIPGIRKSYRTSTYLLDRIVGKIVQQLKSRGMWDDTLLVFTADNGASVSSGGSNYPYRGGKNTLFEGGIRVPSFVSGGLVPHNLRGSSSSQIIHMADWYMTFSHLAGVSQPFDARAAHHGLPPLDGINVYPILAGMADGTTRDIPLSENVLVSGNWKLMIGYEKDDDELAKDVWTEDRIGLQHTVPTDHCEKGCLFDLAADPSERRNLWNEENGIRKQLEQRLMTSRAAFFEAGQDLAGVVSACPGKSDHHCACWTAINCHGGFFGPFYNVTCPTS